MMLKTDLLSKYLLSALINMLVKIKNIKEKPENEHDASDENNKN
jgi:hypothetical protein